MKSAARKREDCCDTLSRCTTLNNALRQIKACSLCHDTYRHYTTLNALLGMIKSETMWLTLGKSAKLDDAQERKKFGAQEVWKRTYLASFVHDVEESAAMWGLYCMGSEKAVCVSFPRESIKRWSIALRKIAKKGGFVLVNPHKRDSADRQPVEEIELFDIAYADVADTYYSDRERGNFVSWDGVRSKCIDSLKGDMKNAQATGVLKDYEWNFEHETRVLVRLKGAVSHASKIAIPLHGNMLKSMSVTLGPWLVEGDKGKFEKKIIDALQGKKIFNQIRVSESSIAGALSKWECGIVSKE